jgi:hypothetical protein
MMNDEFGLTTSGDGVVQVPVEKKDHSKDPVLTTQPVSIPAKKRGRPKKIVTPVTVAAPVVKESIKEEIKPEKIWYCSTCQETISDHNVMRIGAGDNGRCAVFCPMCQRSFGFEDKDLQDKIAALIKDNSTGK